MTKNSDSIESDQKKYENDAGDGTLAEQHYLQGTRLAICTASLLISLLLPAMDQTIVVTILSTVGNKFDAFDKISWIATGFMLSMSVFASTWGKISIAFGRKWTMLGAIALFKVGSLISAVASNFNMLIGGRALAGVGGGGIQTLVFVMISEFVPISKRPVIITCFSIVFSSIAILGPLIGGALTNKVSWRWCFYINLPIGGFSVICLLLFFHPPKPQGSIKEKLKNIDYLGIFLLTSGLVLLLLALSFGGVEFPWKSSAVICCFVIGGLLLTGFIVWNFKFSKDPVLPPAVITVPQLSATCLSIFFMFFTYMTTVYYVSSYFQVVRNKSALGAGLSLLPMIIPLCIVSVSCGFICKKTRHVKPFMVAGAALAPIGTGLLCLLQPLSSSSKRIGLLIPLGVAIGLQLQPGIISTQLRAPSDVPGSMIMATSYMNFMRSLGGAFGTELGQTVFNASFKKKLLEQISHHPGMDTIAIDVAHASRFISSPELIQKLALPEKEIVLKAVVESQHNIFYMTIGAASLALFFAMFSTNRRLPQEDKKE